MSMLSAAYCACALAFAGLSALIAAGRPSNRNGWQALAAAALTSIWAFTAAFSGFGFIEAVPLAESVRTLVWVTFAGSLLMSARGDAANRKKVWLFAGPTLGAALVLVDVIRFVAEPTVFSLSAEQLLGRIAVTILGIVEVENLYRNSSEESRWNVAPICIALGGIFVCDLVLYSDVVLLRRVDPILLAARSIALASTVPLIVLAMARNRNWRIDIHVSRGVVLHTASFIVSGAFLLSVALVATVFRNHPSPWGTVTQLSVMFAGVLVVALALTSSSFRSRLKHFVVENFFSHRYDYRAEWMKFIQALAASNAAELEVRVIRAVADIVDSPAGMLWLLNGRSFRPAAAWNAPLPDGIIEAADSPFIARFCDGTAIPRLDEVHPDVVSPEWIEQFERPWLAVPLMHQSALLGFLLLAQARSPCRVDWEVSQLLGAVARQAASYLSEAQATRTVAETMQLSAYSKRFAFVVHDIKNLVSQLSLLLANAEKFGDDPAFQQDALLTIRSSVERMNKLLLQLKYAEGEEPKSARSADVEQVARDVIANVKKGARVLTALSGHLPPASMEPASLHSALTHLVNNALEASGDNGGVTVGVRSNGQHITVDVSDHGPGMAAAFIRNELFRPFRSTKSSGYGIGAYQVRELVRAAGGDLEVISRPGSGTTMRLVIPVARQSQAQLISMT